MSRIESTLERFYVPRLVSSVDWERRVIGERTSAATQAAKRQGRHMGPVSALPEATGARLLEVRASHTLVATETL